MPAQKRISEFFTPTDLNKANNSSQTINSCDETEMPSSNKKQKPNSAGGAGRRVPLQAISESTLNIQANRTVTTARRVTRSMKEDTRDHSVTMDTRDHSVTMDTRDHSVSSKSGTMARPVTRSMNKRDTRDQAVSSKSGTMARRVTRSMKEDTRDHSVTIDTRDLSVSSKSSAMARPVTRSIANTGTRDHSVTIDTRDLSVSNKSGTTARPVTRSMNKRDTRDQAVPKKTADTKGKSVSSLFSLFKEKSEKPLIEVPDSEDESDEAGPGKPQVVVPDSDDEWDEALVDDTEPVGTGMVGVKPLLSNKHQIDDSGAEYDGIDASALVDDDEYTLPEIPENASEVDEDDAMLDGADLLIDEDDYIPFEDDSEDADADADADADSDETSEPPLKRQRLDKTELDAAAWVEACNASQSVDEDDADVQRFRHNWTVVIETFCEWATEESLDNWRRRTRELKEMAASFRALFARAAAHPEKLVQMCLEGIPLQTQKLLGKEDLEEIDLLDLPLVPLGCKHRVVYIDVATRLRGDQIHQVRKDGGKLCKVAKRSSYLKDALDVKLYVGSSVNKHGGYVRVQQHERAALGHGKAESGFHHTQIVKPDVLCNFRLLGAWQNPFAGGRSQVDQDLARWVAPMVEGLMIAFLGLYTKANKCVSIPTLFTDSSYALVRRIRRGIALPDFSSSSLNRAWPLLQGTSGGIVLLSKCANPECLRPRIGSKAAIPPGIKGLEKVNFRRLDCWNLLAPYYCGGCVKNYKKNGEIRTREGLSTGRWGHEMDVDSMNKAWFDKHGRKCQNKTCGVPIHTSADVYGIENGIRCLRCYKYAMRFHEEYSPLDSDAENYGDCEICLCQDVCIFSWNKVHRNEPDLPTELCGDCYSTRCSFFQDDVPLKAQPKTYGTCANPACWSEARAVLHEGKRTFIENINEHLWRCLRCDYCHEIGIEKLERLEDVPKPPTGPIASHRFNCTKCIDCERYISSQDWKKAENGYRCTSCVGARCSKCNRDPVLLRIIQNSTVGEMRCIFCNGYERKTSIKHYPKARISPNTKCYNEHCSNTGSNWTGSWAYDPEHPGDVSRKRCLRCHHFLRYNGIEWCPTAKCYNESCDISGPDVTWYRGADGNSRCHPCHMSFYRVGAERPCKARCHNYDVCGHDYTNYTNSFRIDIRGDGDVRCRNCHVSWLQNGRQHEVGAKLHPPTKSGKKCSRPGCHAEGQPKAQWHRWFEFKPDGYVCHPCFKLLVAIQNGAEPLQEDDGNQQDAITPGNESRPDTSGGGGPATGSQ